MTNESQVLIVSTIADVATDDVVRRLAACDCGARILGRVGWQVKHALPCRARASTDHDWKG